MNSEIAINVMRSYFIDRDRDGKRKVGKMEQGPSGIVETSGGYARELRRRSHPML
jgi:hypothetical protein